MFRNNKKLDPEIEEIISNVKYAARVLAGGPDERGLKLLKASGFFLVVPDPTMISTSIGLTMLATGKLLSRRRKKGLTDIVREQLEEASVILREAGEL